MGTPPPLYVLLPAVLLLVVSRGAAASWCIAKSGTPAPSLQQALDYACGPAAGADCGPIQQGGLCYLPNTLAAHASYAFNSFYQRSSAAPGSCDFAGTATVTLSDPSYGSCTYPSSASTAGGSSSSSAPPSTPSTTNPTTTPPAQPAGNILAPPAPVLLPLPPPPPPSTLGGGNAGGFGGLNNPTTGFGSTTQPADNTSDISSAQKHFRVKLFTHITFLLGGVFLLHNVGSR